MKKRFAHLTQSLQEEEKKVKDKFEKADQALNIKQRIPLVKTSSEKVVREGISLTSQESEIVAKLQSKLTNPPFYPSKSEIWRAALHLFNQQELTELTKLIHQLPKIKKGKR